MWKVQLFKLNYDGQEQEAVKEVQQTKSKNKSDMVIPLRQRLGKTA